MANVFARTTNLQQGRAIVDAAGRPTVEFQTLINTNNKNVVTAINALANIPQIQAALQGLDAKSAQLDQTLQTAQDAIAQAQQQTDAQKREAALQGSYIDPASVLTATPTTITIASHTRRYADGTSVTVSGGTITATAPGDTDYISYSDPQRAGGTVAYMITATAPAQTGDTHVVGAILIPSTGTAEGGDGPRQPGYVTPRQPLP